MTLSRHFLAYLVLATCLATYMAFITIPPVTAAPRDVKERQEKSTNLAFASGRRAEGSWQLDACGSGSGGGPDAARVLVDKLLAENKVVVFSKSYCPYCSQTKSLLQSLAVDAVVLELDDRADGNDVSAVLREMTGQRTFPNTFINGQQVGGNDKLQAAHRSGQLAALLEG